jgi:hypothetical protein
MDITISFSTTPSLSVGPFTVTVRDGSNTATQTFLNVSRATIIGGYLIQNITSLDESIRVESSGTCSTLDTVDISSVTGGGGGGGGEHTSNSVFYYGLDGVNACNVVSGLPVTVFYDGLLSSLMSGDSLYEDQTGTPLTSGYYFNDGLTYGLFYVAAGGQISTISDCSGNAP